MSQSVVLQIELPEDLQGFQLPKGVNGCMQVLAWDLAGQRRNPHPGGEG